MSVPGPRKLLRYLKRQKLPLRRTAEKLKCSTPCLTFWTRGRCKPEPFFQLAIQRLTGGEVKVEDWLTDKQRALLRKIPDGTEQPVVGRGRARRRASLTEAEIRAGLERDAAAHALTPPVTAPTLEGEGA